MEMNNHPTIKSSTAFQKCKNIRPLINRVGLSLWGAAMVAVKQWKMLIYISNKCKTPKLACKVNLMCFSKLNTNEKTYKSMSEMHEKGVKTEVMR